MASGVVVAYRVSGTVDTNGPTSGVKPSSCRDEYLDVAMRPWI
jgi:hypothetical protein